MHIKYEDLINNFEDTMKKIALFLGCSKNNFIQENRRVGWYDLSEEGENFS